MGRLGKAALSLRSTIGGTGAQRSRRDRDSRKELNKERKMLQGQGEEAFEESSMGSLLRKSRKSEEGEK